MVANKVVKEHFTALEYNNNSLQINENLPPSKHSPVSNPCFYVDYLDDKSSDILIVTFADQELLWPSEYVTQWASLGFSTMQFCNKVAFILFTMSLRHKHVMLVIKSSRNAQNIVEFVHDYSMIQSIYIETSQEQLVTMRRFARAYFKLDVVLDNQRDVMIQLAADLIAHCENIGDEFSENGQNDMAYRNYKQALDLSNWMKQLIPV